MKPTLPAMNPTATGQALRRHLRSHNGSVLAASLMALGSALAGWATLYGVAYWVAMFCATITHGVDGQPPASFHWVFLACAGILMVAALVDGRLFPDERAVDTRPPVEHLTDIALFIPRLTLAFWGNLSALVSLSASDRQEAADLLDRLKIEGKVSLQQLPAQVPDETSRTRILEALSVAQLIDVRRADGLTWLYLSSLAPDEFHRPALDDDSRSQAATGMRSANPRERRNLLTGRPAVADDETKPG